MYIPLIKYQVFSDRFAIFSKKKLWHETTYEGVKLENFTNSQI